MATAGLFERQLQVATAGLEPAAIAKLLATTARRALAEALAAGEASDSYTRSVNGRIGASEDSVVPPGPIVYRFHYLEEAAAYALAFCRARSPVLSGRYKRSWFALVNQTVWSETFPIPPGAEVTITNDQPYHRKIEVGAMQMRVAPRIVESARAAVQRQFKFSVTAERRFITLAGGARTGEGGPGAYDRGRAFDARGNRVRAGGRRGGAPRDMTYPALILRAA